MKDGNSEQPISTVALTVKSMEDIPANKYAADIQTDEWKILQMDSSGPTCVV